MGEEEEKEVFVVDIVVGRSEAKAVGGGVEVFGVTNDVGRIVV